MPLRARVRLRPRASHECARRWLGFATAWDAQTGGCDGLQFPLSLVSSLPCDTTAVLRPRIEPGPWNYSGAQGTVWNCTWLFLFTFWYYTVIWENFCTFHLIITKYFTSVHQPSSWLKGFFYFACNQPTSLTPETVNCNPASFINICDTLVYTCVVKIASIASDIISQIR